MALIYVDAITNRPGIYQDQFRMKLVWGAIPYNAFNIIFNENNIHADPDFNLSSTIQSPDY